MITTLYIPWADVCKASAEMKRIAANKRMVLINLIPYGTIIKFCEMHVLIVTACSEILLNYPKKFILYVKLEQSARNNILHQQ